MQPGQGGGDAVTPPHLQSDRPHRCPWGSGPARNPTCKAFCENLVPSDVGGRRVGWPPQTSARQHSRLETRCPSLSRSRVCPLLSQPVPFPSAGSKGRLVSPGGKSCCLGCVCLGPSVQGAEVGVPREGRTWHLWLESGGPRGGGRGRGRGQAARMPGCLGGPAGGLGRGLRHSGWGGGRLFLQLLIFAPWQRER